MSGYGSIQGMDKQRQLDPRLFQPDIRSGYRKLIDWLRITENVIVTMFMMTAVSFMYSPIAQILIPLMIPLVWKSLRIKESSILKLPVQSKILDPNEINPQTQKPMMAQGIFFLGNDIATGKEVWLTNDDCRQHFLVLGTTGSGKATSKNALIHSPSGWIKAGDIKVGDLISCPVESGNSVVTGVYPQGLKNLWKVTFKDGRSANVCKEHLWETYLEGSDTFDVLSTEQIKEKLNNITISIPLPIALEKPSANLSIDPYEFGLMLSVNINKNKLVASNGCDLKKVIPEEYKNSSIEQRWALVQGLLKNKGNNINNNHLMFSSDSKQLVKDVQEIVWSLGGIANVCKPAKLASKIFHYVSIQHPESWRFFYKQERPKLYKHNELKLPVVSIHEDFLEEESVCIMVDHPRHLYVIDNYVVTHNTELLVGFAANAISWGSGLLFCDGKGDVSLWAKIYVLARKFGREDDLLVLNFMNGNKDNISGDGKLKSNTLNPFADGASDNLTQMIAGLMADSGGDGMWKGRAVAMLTGVVKALVWLRDKGELDLNVGVIREYMALKNIISLASVKDWPNLPQDIRLSVMSYLTSLPGYQESKGTSQSPTTLDQHGYLEMQFSQIFGSLNDVYGHIFKSAYGQIDMMDVVLSRRILVVMLPALEKSTDEIANLGKIIVANLKGMMGGTLGSSIEGSWDEVVKRRPTSAPAPFMCILDEVGYYTVDGLALIAAQARSLGFSMVYASQDIPAMEKRNKEEAKSIFGNTNIKIFMKIEEADVTGAMAVNIGGEAYRATLGDMEKQDTELGHAFRNGRSVRFEEKKRISFLDLKSQGPGEFTVTYRGEIVRMRGFYADPSSSVEEDKIFMRPNHFIEVARPDPTILTKEQESETCMTMLVSDEHEARIAQAVNETMEGLKEAWASGNEIALSARMWDKSMAPVNDPVTSSCCVIAELANIISGSINRGSADMRSRSRSRPRSMIDDDDDNENNGMDDFMGEERRPMSERKARVDTSVQHGVSVDGKESWNSKRTLSNKRNLIKCLADLDSDDDNKTTEDIDKMIDDNLKVPEKVVEDNIVAKRAQEFENVVEEIKEIKETKEKSTEPKLAKVSSTETKAKAKEEDDSSDSSSGGSSSGDDKMVEDFINELMGS